MANEVLADFSKPCGECETGGCSSCSGRGWLEATDAVDALLACYPDAPIVGIRRDTGEVVAVPDAEEPPPFGSAPFGTMFVPGDVWINGDNEWHEFPGPMTLPPRPMLTEDERKLVDACRPSEREYSTNDAATDMARATIVSLVAIIDRLAPSENREPGT